MIKYSIDDIYISYNSDDEISVTGQTIAKVNNCRGKQLTISVKHPSFSLDLLYVKWSNGEKDMRALVNKGNQKMRTINDRLRLAIDDYSAPGEKTKYYTCALKQARLVKNLTWHSNLFDASEAELNDAAGYDVIHSLRKFGALKVGTKERLFWDTGKARNRLWMIFPKENIDVLILAFLFTRVLPVYNYKGR